MNIHLRKVSFIIRLNNIKMQKPIVLKDAQIEKLLSVIKKESKDAANYRSDKELVEFFNQFGYMDGFAENVGIILPGYMIVDSYRYVRYRLQELNEFHLITMVVDKFFKEGQVNEKDVDIIKDVFASYDVVREGSKNVFSFMSDYYIDHDVNLMRQLLTQMSIRHMENLMVSDMTEIDNEIFLVLDFVKNMYLAKRLHIYDRVLKASLLEFTKALTDFKEMVKTSYRGDAYGNYIFMETKRTGAQKLNDVIKYRDSVLMKSYARMKEYIAVTYPQIDLY